MITTSDFKTGITIEYDGNIYTVLEFQHVKSANSMAFVRTKLKNMRSGAIIEIAINPKDKIKKAMIEKKKMQYLYDGGHSLVFMDMDTYDQLEIPSENLTYDKNFLVEGASVQV
ncbi:MAG TPA: elongation factor P, partial [Bacilli bacterium]|nr:elongation factor P [Bacilli bacterium]